MKRVAALAILSAALAYGQTLTLTGPATARPGTVIAVNVALASPPASLAALQWLVTLPAGYTATAVAGAASVTAAKTLYCNPASTTCLTVGINNNVYAAGVAAVYSLAIPATAAPGPVSVPLSGLVGASLAGGNVPLTAGTAYSVLILAPTDLNGDGKTDVQDLQIMIQRILEPGAEVTVRDAQLVAKAALEAVGWTPAPRTFEVAYSMRLEGCVPQYHASVLVACCARADRCGLRDDQIAWGPCAKP